MNNYPMDGRGGPECLERQAADSLARQYDERVREEDAALEEMDQLLEDLKSQVAILLDPAGTLDDDGWPWADRLRDKVEKLMADISVEVNGRPQLVEIQRLSAGQYIMEKL